MPNRDILPGTGFGETIAKASPAATGAWSQVFSITDSRQIVQINSVIITVVATSTNGGTIVGRVGITTTSGTDPTNNEIIARFTTSDLLDKDWSLVEFNTGIWLTATSHSLWVRGDNTSAVDNPGFLIVGTKYDNPA